MIEDHSQHSLGRFVSLRVAMLCLAGALLLALAASGPALAQLKGDFTVFAQCPASTPEVQVCIYAVNTGKQLQIGKVKIPINKAITLQGGVIVDEETGQEKLVRAANGETLSKTALNVPGGIAGIVETQGLTPALKASLEKLIKEGLTGVTATPELVGTPTISRTNLLFEEGIALGLPIRIKLSNPFLGSECYVGTQASPVTLQLTTGTTSPPQPNEPIAGSAGELELKDQGQIVVVKSYKLVDNAFSAPGTTGCGGSMNSVYVDPAVDTGIGLPAASGQNTAILEGTMQSGSAEEVLKQMK
jgi:hypothetical protein